MADPTYYGVQPYTFFDATYYIQQNPDVVAGWTQSPLEHYIQYGAAEGRAPNAWFNWSAYAALNPDLTAAGINGALALFEHYNDWGYAEGRISAYNFVNFDGAQYLTDNPDVAAAGYTSVTAVNHYMEYGEYEGRAAYQTNGTPIVPPVDDLGNPYTLTTGIDTVPAFLGTIYNDTYNASLAGPNGTSNTLNPLDSINGLAGIDTLNAQIQTSVTPAGLSNIEILNATFSNAGQTLNLLNGGQLTNVNNVGSTTNATFSNIVAGADLGVNGTDQNTTFTYRVTSGTESANLTLTNVTGGTQTVTAVETINLTSAGGDVNDTTLAGGLTTLNVAGSTDLDLNVVNATVTSLNAADFTGDLDANISAQVSSATATTVVGGQGDNIFRATDVAIGNGVVASVLTGGAGTNTLVASSAVDRTVVTAGGITITNIEDMDLIARDDAGAGTAADLTLNAALVGGLETVGVSAADLADVNAFFVTGLTAAQTVSVDLAATGATLNLQGGTGVTAVNVDLNLGADSGSAILINENGATTALTTVNLTSDANSYTDVDFEAGAFTTLNIDGGAAGETLTVGSNTAINAATVNAADLDSDLVATFGSAGQSIVGGNGDDTLIFGTNLGTTDTVDGGLGDNTVTFTLGAGLVGPHLTNVQNLDVTLTAASNTISLQNSSGVEVIDIVATAAGTDDATFTNLDASLTDVVVSDSVGDLSVTTAAGQLANVTVTIGTQGVVSTDVVNATFNTRGSLTVAAVDDLAGAGTESITTTLATNATSLTFATASDDDLTVGATVTANSATSLSFNTAVDGGILDAAGAITANAATAVSLTAAAGNVSVDGANSFDSLNTLTVAATLGADAVFVGTSNTAEANLTIGSVTLTTDDEASTVTNTVSLTASTAAAANLSATLGSLDITNGIDSDVTSTTTLTATNTGAASITSVDIVNGGAVVGDLVTANLNFVAGAAGTASIGALNVDVGDAEVDVALDVGAGQTVIDIDSGTILGAGTLAVSTTDVTALDLSNLDVSGFTGTLTVAGDADLVNVVGTAYGEAITFNAAALASDVTGAGGSDFITLSTGAGVDNTATYLAQSDSTGTVYDYIDNFDVGAGNDLIDLSALLLGGAAYGGVTADATVTYTSDTNVTFTIAAADAVGFFGAGQALAADDGAGNNASVVFVDANLSGSWEAASDMAIVLVGVDAANIVNGNFVWA